MAPHALIDGTRDAQGVKQPVPRWVADTILDALGLSRAYPWCTPSRNGGWHIVFRCHGAARSILNGASVMAGELCVEMAEHVHQIEVKWNKSTILLGNPEKMNGMLPVQGPREVSLERVESLARMLHALGPPAGANDTGHVVESAGVANRDNEGAGGRIVSGGECAANRNIDGWICGGTALSE